MSKIIFLVFVLFVNFSCSNTPEQKAATKNILEPVSVKNDWYPGPQFIGYYVAQNKGFYKEKSLKVTLTHLENYSEMARTAAEMVAGKYDFSSGSSQVSLSQKNGLPIVAISSIYQFGPHVFFARADSGITTPSDFAGKTVAVKSISWRNLLDHLLSQANLNLSDIKEFTPKKNDMTPFYEGQVDIWSGFLANEPVEARLKGFKLVTFPLYEYGISSIGNVIYITKDKLKNNKDQVERFLSATLQGWLWAVNHPEDAVDIMLATIPSLSKSRDFYLASFNAAIPLIRPPGEVVGQINCDDWLQDFQLTDLKGVTPDELCTQSIHKEIAVDLVK